MLIPMTSSLYVPGKIKNVNKVLVDVGTGYFVEKEKEEAIKYVQRKLEMMYEKENEAAVGLMRKKESLKVTTDVMQMRLMELQAGGGARR
jgi:prefoldin alpha subunit